MDKNSTRKLGLSALIGLFAFYGLTAHNLKIGSVSSSGIVIKYTKRGLAAAENKISCLKTKNAIDETAVDRFTDQECIFHVSPKTLGNGDTEYTVTTYYKGHTTIGTKIYPAQEIAGAEDHNKNFIIDTIKKSKAKFDVAQENLSKVELANAAVDESSAETEEVPPADTVVAEEAAPALKEKNSDGRPALSLPKSSDDEDSSELSSVNEDSFDDEALEDAINDYRELKASYSSCETNQSESKEIKTLEKYENLVSSYIQNIDEYESSNGDGRTPFERLSSKELSKLKEFSAKVDEVRSGSDDDYEDDDRDERVRSSDNSSKIETCLMARNKEIKNKEEQFEHYAQNIQPILRQEMQVDSPDQFANVTGSLNDSNNPFVALASGNEYIASSVRADYLGANTRVSLLQIDKLKASAKTTAELMNLDRQADEINSKYSLEMSQMIASNPKLAPHLNNGDQYWAQQIASFNLTSPVDTPSLTSVSATNGQISPDSQTAELEAFRALVLKRLQISKNGSGKARIIAPMRSNRAIPQVGDSVSSGPIRGE